MKNKQGNNISQDTIRAVIERNDLRELIRLFADLCIGRVSQHTRNWYFENYLKLVDKGTAAMYEWAMSSQIIDSILTHPEYRNRVRRSVCVVQQLEEVN